MKILYVADTYLPVVSGTVRIVDEYLKAHPESVLLTTSTDWRFRTENRFGSILYRLPAGKNPFRSDHYVAIFPSPFLIQQILRREQPDLIHIITPGLIGLTTLAIARRQRVPMIASCFGLPEFAASYLQHFPFRLSSIMNAFLWQYLSWFYNRVGLVHVLTNYVQQQLVRHAVTTPIQKIPFWIEEPASKIEDQIARIKIKYQIPLNRKIFLYLGRVDHDKNLDFLIQALHPKVNPQFDQKGFLMIAGQGAYTPRLKQLIEQHQVEDLVKLTGFVPAVDKSAVYYSADAFIIPAQYETLSLVSLEALAHGLPVIMANAGALPEIASRFPAKCFLFDSSNLPDLIGTINQILNMPRLSINSSINPPAGLNHFYGKKAILKQMAGLYSSTRTK